MVNGTCKWLIVSGITLTSLKTDCNSVLNNPEGPVFLAHQTGVSAVFTHMRSLLSHTPYQLVGAERRAARRKTGDVIVTFKSVVNFNFDGRCAGCMRSRTEVGDQVMSHLSVFRIFKIKMRHLMVSKKKNLS